MGRCPTPPTPTPQKKRPKQPDLCESGFATIRQALNTGPITYNVKTTTEIWEHVGELPLDKAFTQLAELYLAVAAMRYWQQAMHLAHEAADRHMAGFSLKTLGAAYYYQGQYAEAARTYMAALAVFDQMGKQAEVAGMHCDLAEVYAELNQLTEARAHYAEALTQAQTLNHTAYLKFLHDLRQQFPALAPKVPDPVAQVLARIQQQGFTTSKDCATLLDHSQRTAGRWLDKMVKQGLLIKTGAARATQYHLPQA